MILCADDYGLSEDINLAILELCALGKLSAVSCMVVLERCTPGALKQLLAHQSRMDVGLHLCLTDEGLPLSTPSAGVGAQQRFPSFGGLLRRSLRHQVDSREIAREVLAQYELFVEKCGRKPDFIDGHLHAHQLPVVRDGLLAAVRSLPSDCRPYIRNTRLPLRELWSRGLPWLKAAFIGAFGAKMFKQLRAAGVSTNDGFAGIYDFRRWRRYGTYFPRFIACLRHPNSILVMHPGRNEEWRRQEFATLREFARAKPPNRFLRG